MDFEKKFKERFLENIKLWRKDDVHVFWKDIYASRLDGMIFAAECHSTELLKWCLEQTDKVSVA